MTASDRDHPLDFIDDALKSYPVAPAPEGMKADVLRRVRSLTPIKPQAFPWLEASIGVMAATVLAGSLYLLEGLPPAAVLRGQRTIELFFSHPVYRPMLIAIVVGVCFLACCFILAGRLFRFSSVRRASRVHKQ